MEKDDKFEFEVMSLECLFAYSYLWAWGFCSMQEYNALLDRMFSETPDNKTLLELEECSNNYKETFARLKRYFEHDTDTFNSYLFGKTLFSGLESAYKSDAYTIAEFGKKCMRKRLVFIKISGKSSL